MSMIYLESKHDSKVKKFKQMMFGREHSSQCPKKIITKLLKLSDSSPKTHLTSVPSPLQSLNLRPAKRAVLCGVTYKRNYELKGTINDVKNIRNMLMERFEFHENGIVVLTEEETAEHIPTKKNIERALKWLVNDCKSRESLVYYFSGHGWKQPGFIGDETDGFGNEAICPLDFMREGIITANDINSIIVKPLVKGVTLHAIVDASHSGTILDLKYKYDRMRKKWDDSIPPTTPSYKTATSGGLVICISACADDQLASETSAFSGKTINGAMTYILTKSIREFPGLTYGDLLDLILEQVNQNERIINASMRSLKRIDKNSLSQETQLTSSEQFDAYKAMVRF